MTRQSLQKIPAATRKRPGRLIPKKISIARLPVTRSDVLGREEDIAFLDRAWANKDVNVVTILPIYGVWSVMTKRTWKRNAHTADGRIRPSPCPTKRIGSSFMDIMGRREFGGYTGAPHAANSLLRQARDRAPKSQKSTLSPSPLLQKFLMRRGSIWAKRRGACTLPLEPLCFARAQ